VGQTLVNAGVSTKAFNLEQVISNHLFPKRGLNVSDPSRHTRDRKIDTPLAEEVESAKGVSTNKPTTNWIDAKAKYLARRANRTKTGALT